jgi:hypothetical protein
VREAWIPGVEIFSRTIHHQRHRGIFGEFIRRDEGLMEKIGFWPVQWANARMFAQTAKGFHVHPPSIPEGTKPEDLAKYLFDKHHIFTVPIVHEEFQGIRVTPNVYTALSELDRFCEQMDLIARNGLPA